MPHLRSLMKHMLTHSDDSVPKASSFIIHEALVKRNRVFIRCELSGQPASPVLRLVITERGRLYCNHYAQSFPFSNAEALQGLARRIEANCKVPSNHLVHRNQKLGWIVRKMLGIQEYRVLGDICCERVPYTTFYRVKCDNEYFILVNFQRRKYRLLPLSFIEDFWRFLVESAKIGKYQK